MQELGFGKAPSGTAWRASKLAGGLEEGALPGRGWSSKAKWCANAPFESGVLRKGGGSLVVSGPTKTAGARRYDHQRSWS